MTYRCSVLGHDYGETDIERDEDRREDVLVTTVREVETCKRCGDQNVISRYPITTPLTSANETEEDATESEDTAEPEENPAEDTEDATKESTADPETPLQYQEESPSTEYECSECGFIAEPDDSPLQAGDLCPECHQSYLTADT